MATAGILVRDKPYVGPLARNYNIKVGLKNWNFLFVGFKKITDLLVFCIVHDNKNKGAPSTKTINYK